MFKTGAWCNKNDSIESIKILNFQLIGIRVFPTSIDECDCIKDRDDWDDNPETVDHNDQDRDCLRRVGELNSQKYDIYCSFLLSII